MALVVLGSSWGQPGATTAPASAAPQPSSAPVVAISSSWFCAGATEYPASVAAGTLVFANPGPSPVVGSVQLVTQLGYRRTVAVEVPERGLVSLPETLPGLPGSSSDHWVGALVTLYGGLVSVNQVLSTVRGSTSQPCASSAARQWYFPDGATLRNAWDEISLLNPYPQLAIADLSFTTELGREEPMDFQGIVVPAQGLTVVDLGSHLRRRQHIAVTVSARTGEVVAFQTEIVTAPPAGAPPRGTPGAMNPAVPVPGVTLVLGSSGPAPSLWWPAGGEGPGLTESYAVYNPNGAPSRLQLELRSASGARGASALNLGPYGSTFLTTNGSPWALPGVLYAAHLVSTNGVGVVAERFVMSAPPSPGRGLAVLLGESQAASQWSITPGPAGLGLSERGLGLFGQARLALLNPGSASAVASVEVGQGRSLVPLEGAQDVSLAPGAPTLVGLPSSLDACPLVVRSSAPILIEQDWTSSLRSVGTNLAPVAALTSP